MAQNISAGVTKEILREGNGPQVVCGNTITVHCTGSLAETGKKFWSTKDPDQKPFTFKCGLNQVITGWDEGCLSMRQGEEARLTISSDKGYGRKGFPAWGASSNIGLSDRDLEHHSIRHRMKVG